MNDNQGNSWCSVINITINAPELDHTTFTIDDSFGNSRNPVLSIGYELNQYKRVSLRTGLMLGGKYKSGFSFGVGINTPIRFDFAISTKNSIKLMESRGLEFSCGALIDLDF